MTNEMKLLMALCDALGFEVEVIYKHSLDGVNLDDNKPYHLEANRINDVVIDINYKLTKKSASVPFNSSIITEYHQHMAEMIKTARATICKEVK